MKNKLLLLSLMLLATFSINAQVFITEIADPNNEAAARYVELYNAGSADVDLSTGWQINRYTNNNATPQTAVDLTGTITAGGFYIICNNATIFNATYGFDADQDIGTGGPADSNGDDQILLLSPGSVVVDFFGVIAEDGSNTCHEFEDGRAERIASVVVGNPAWDESEWNVWSDFSTAAGCTNHISDAPQTAPGDFDPGSWIGAATPTNDQTSTVTAPGTQLAAGTISSIATDSIPVLQFVITDASGDGLPTNVTGVKFVAGPNNTLVFDESLAGGAVWDKTNNVAVPFSGAPVVDATSAYLPINLIVPEGGAITVEVALYIDPTNAPDGAVAQFQINAASHGFTASTAGSDFETTFAGGDIVGNNFTVDVVATQLSFTQQPTNVVKDATMTPAVTVAATDAGGNVDTDFAVTDITLALTGTGTMSGTNPVSTSSGVATFSDLTFDTENTGATLTANGGTLIEAVSTTFNITATAEGTLFFSEYIEALTGNNKAVEIYNPTSNAVDLTGYQVKLASNANSWGNFADLTGYTLAAGDVFVISNSGADDPSITNNSDMTSNITYFNGNDALGLFKDGVLIDVIGVPGANVDQDVAGVTAATADHTLLRKYPGVTTGNTDWASSAGTDVASSEWEVLPADTYSNIGWHGTPPPAIPNISGIGITPIAPTSGDIVTVAATITDDVGVIGAELYWSLVSPVTIADNSATMVAGANDLFEGTIPAQADGTTVYYMIAAYDASKGMATSPEQSYTVTDPVLPTEVATIAELRAGATDGTVYKLTGEAVLTFQQSYRSQKFIEDATAAILIDDYSGTITTVYNRYDGITGITGTLSEYEGMLQFIPTEDPGAATSTGNMITPQVITLSEFNTNFEDYEAELITINDVTFADAGGTFATGTEYVINDASKGTGTFRTNFYAADYISTTIPSNVNITGVSIEKDPEGYTFSARDLNDFDVILTPALTITSPANASTVSSADVDIIFTVDDFTVGDNSSGTDDGYIMYNVDAGSDMTQYTTDAISLMALTEGPHTVNMSLVDNAGSPLTPAVDASVTFTVNTGINVNTVNSGNISVYPNPANNTLFIKNSDKVVSVDIFNILGQKVENISVISSEINISNLQNGMYVARFLTKEGSTISVNFVKK